MGFILTEEQELLKETAHEFIQEKSPVAELRRLRDSVDESGFDRKLFSEMAELGWTGVVYPEDFGGLDMGYFELGQIFEECGRSLVAQPILSSVVLGGGCVLEGGNELQRKDILTAVCAGEKLLSLAFQERSHHSPHHVETTAELSGDHFVLNGCKTFVLDGHVADQLVVVARTSGAKSDREGLTLFLVDADAEGLQVDRTIMVDGRNAANLGLDSVKVEKSAVLGEVDHGADVLDLVLDRATIMLCAEMLGTLDEAFQKTLEYLKTREQFGVLIGSFQALKHRAANMFVEAELSRSIVMEAMSELDSGNRERLSMLASCAKARLNDALLLICNEAVQMHGGIGVTDEEDIGLYLKRGRVMAETLGASSWHRDRYATLGGY
ncbi:MAG: acyl-CoA dehydrogenase [Myxococcota bacterium]|nr:acyl-CoA dehydrogenase [Myxococcota bacterium]